MPLSPSFVSALRGPTHRINCALAHDNHWDVPLDLVAGGPVLIDEALSAQSPVSTPDSIYLPLLKRLVRLEQQSFLWLCYGVLVCAYQAEQCNKQAEFVSDVKRLISKSQRQRVQAGTDALALLIRSDPDLFVSYVNSTPFRWYWLAKHCLRWARDETLVKLIVSTAVNRAATLDQEQFVQLATEVVSPTPPPDPAADLEMKDWSQVGSVQQHESDKVSWAFKEKMGIVCPCIVFFCGQPRSGKTFAARSWLEYMKGVYSQIHLAARAIDQPIYQEMKANQQQYGFEVVPTSFQDYKFDPTQNDGLQRLLWIDDQIGQSYTDAVISTVNLGSHTGWSTWVLSQNFTEVNKLVRGSAMYFVLKRMPDDVAVANILRRFNLPKQAIDLYREITSDPTGSFMIDTRGPEHMRFRNNFTPIANLQQRLYPAPSSQGQSMVQSVPVRSAAVQPAAVRSAAVRSAAVQPLAIQPVQSVQSTVQPVQSVQSTVQPVQPVHVPGPVHVIHPVQPTPQPTSVLGIPARTRHDQWTLVQDEVARSPNHKLVHTAEGIWNRRLDSQDSLARELRQLKYALPIESWEWLWSTLTHRCMQTVQSLINRNMWIHVRRALYNALLDVQLSDLVHVDLLCGTNGELWTDAFSQACLLEGVRGMTTVHIDTDPKAVERARRLWPKSRHLVVQPINADFDVERVPLAAVVSATVAESQQTEVLDALFSLAQSDNLPNCIVLELHGEVDVEDMGTRFAEFGYTVHAQPPFYTLALGEKWVAGDELSRLEVMRSAVRAQDDRPLLLAKRIENDAYTIDESLLSLEIAEDSDEEDAEEEKRPMASPIPLKTVLAYPGGKTRAVKQLRAIREEHFPGTRVLYSPCHGGMSFELACVDDGMRVYANDMFPILSEFWQQVKADRQAIEDVYMSEPIVRPGRERWNEMKDTLVNHADTLTPAQRAAYFLVLNKSSFSGQTLSSSYSTAAGTCVLRPGYLNRCGDLEAVEFSNMSAMDWLPNVPVGDDTLIFADPPYYLAHRKRGLYGVSGDHHSNFDHTAFRDELVKHPRWMLTYNDTPLVRELYKGYTILELTFHYGMRMCTNGEVRTTANELVILSKRVEEP